MVLPNFLHIGPPKAGSSWLHEVLARHPNIFMTEAKELYFFDRYFDRGLPWYEAQFNNAGPEHNVVGEVCPLYLSSREAPQRIRSSLGDKVRLMVTLRDPVDRAFSHYLYLRKRGPAPNSFRDALERWPGLIYLGRYATQLRRYLRHFDQNLIYVGLFDDLRRDPQDFLDRVLAWLGAPPLTLGSTQRAPKLPASRPRSVQVAHAVQSSAKWAREHDHARLVGRLKRSTIVQRFLYAPLGEARPAVSEDDAAYIRKQLSSEITALEEMLGRALRQEWRWEAARHR